MSPDDGAPGLVRLLGAAREDLAEDVPVPAFAREADHAERVEGLAAHGVDVADGVGRGDGAVVARVVDDGREEVDRGDQCARLVQAHDGGVVAVLGADEQRARAGQLR